MSEETNANITLNDFIVMVKLIDVCSKRGAFEGVELKDVGMLRGRLAAFIEANKPKEEESQEQLDLSEKEETAEV